MDKAVNFSAGGSVDTDKVYDTCIIVYSIRTIFTGVLVFPVPLNVAVGRFKNNFAPAVKEFYIHILHILVWRTLYLHFGNSGKITRVKYIVEPASIG